MREHLVIICLPGENSPTHVVPHASQKRRDACNIAAFDEQGTISFEPVTGVTIKDLVIPRQTLDGIWLTITETQTVTLPGA